MSDTNQVSDDDVDGLSPSDDEVTMTVGHTVARTHVVRVALEGTPSGHMPTQADLDAVERFGGASLRRAVEAAAQRIVGIRNMGQMGQARKEAIAYVAELTDGLDAPNADDEIGDDPRALADEARGQGRVAAAVREDVNRIRR